jgi:predicted TIM-barrel fold metal-dependent hydrolase
VIDPERAMREIEELELRPEPKRKLLRENALRLFQLEGSDDLATLSESAAEAS